MRIVEYKYPAVGEKNKERLAVCLGFFDGVHKGHRALIRDTVSEARLRGLVPAVFTFPQETLGLKRGVPRLYTTEEKLGIMAELGIEVVYLADFASVSGLSPREFVCDVLVGDIGAELALSGEDFRFGHRASGDSTMLAALMSECGRAALIHKMERCEVGEGSVEISATLIRESLARGDVRTATLMLGAPYTLRSSVVHGRGFGRTWGYPTLNTEVREGCPLATGVYHTEVKAGERLYTGLTNVGSCPTFGERAIHAETYLIDFEGELYGDEVEIRFLDYIRGERKFDTPEDLRREIEKNVAEIIKGRDI